MRTVFTISMQKTVRAQIGPVKKKKLPNVKKTNKNGFGLDILNCQKTLFSKPSRNLRMIQKNERHFFWKGYSIVYPAQKELDV